MSAQSCFSGVKKLKSFFVSDIFGISAFSSLKLKQKKSSPNEPGPDCLTNSHLSEHELSIR